MAERIICNLSKIIGNLILNNAGKVVLINANKKNKYLDHFCFKFQNWLSNIALKSRVIQNE